MEIYSLKTLIFKKYQSIVVFSYSFFTLYHTTTVVFKIQFKKKKIILIKNVYIGFI